MIFEPVFRRSRSPLEFFDPTVLAQTVFDESQPIDVTGSESTDEKQWLGDWEESDWLRLAIEKTRDKPTTEIEHSMVKQKKLRLAKG